ncbi:MAG: ATP-dependent helicase [Patescibacteria group bacterium]|nr:ATP-dependent helicase [Patescibacteria group bacterium]
MAIDFEKELNKEQFEAVRLGDGPCLVLAGAGTGKTRVITFRVAYLLEKGIKPENILLVTFTNKAAEEMIGRVKRITGMEEKLPWAGTFHHIAYRILKIYAPKLGYKNNFSILDSGDSESLIKLSVKNTRPDSGTKFPSASVLLSAISYARNSDTTIEDALDFKYPQWSHLAETIKTVASDYKMKKKEAQAMDFDDLLINLKILFEKERGVLEKFADQFQYILVDEFQDTNKIQAEIVRLLASKHNNIFVVGDDAQSIYSFRAADIQNILRFEKIYPGAKIFKLTTNYRSAPEILDLANESINNNRRQFKKELKSASSPTGIKPELKPHYDQENEAVFVAKKIRELLGAGTLPEEIAVLFRASHHSQPLEMELMKSGVPYDYRGGMRFFERAHIKDALAFLRVMNNIADAAAWLRVLLKQEGIGPVTAEKIIEAIKIVSARVGANKKEDSDSAVEITEGENALEEIKNIGFEILGEKAKEGWVSFTAILDLLSAVEIKNPSELVFALLDSRYKEYVLSEFTDGKERLDDIIQLAEFAKKYDDLNLFLSEASLFESFNLGNRQSQYKEQTKGALESELVGAKSGSGGKIILSTIHQAKGLEWTAVFIINLSRGAFPSDMALREENGLEEERRLFYVAVTRAKKHLCLTYPLCGGGWGGASGPSLFLEEISPEFLRDSSFLSPHSSLALNDDEEDMHYVSEDAPKIKKGNFLRDLDDL